MDRGWSQDRGLCPLHPNSNSVGTLFSSFLSQCLPKSQFITIYFNYSSILTLISPIFFVLKIIFLNSLYFNFNVFTLHFNYILFSFSSYFTFFTFLLTLHLLPLFKLFNFLIFLSFLILYLYFLLLLLLIFSFPFLYILCSYYFLLLNFQFPFKN